MRNVIRGHLSPISLQKTPVNDVNSVEYWKRLVDKRTKKLELTRELQSCIQKYAINVCMGCETEKAVGIILIDLLTEENNAIRELNEAQELLNEQEQAASR